MKILRNTQLPWQLHTGNLDKLSVLSADKSYDWKQPRRKPRLEGTGRLIKCRELGRYDAVSTVLPNLSSDKSRTDSMAQSSHPYSLNRWIKGCPDGH